MVGVKEFVSRKFVYIQEWKASSAAWILVHTSRSHCGCQSTEDVINTHLGIANFFSACKVFSPFIVIFCTEGRLIVLNRRVFLWLSPTVKFDFTHTHTWWSQWPPSLRRSFAATRLLRLWVRIPPGAWMFVWCVMCCQGEVYATSWSLVRRSLTDYGELWCDPETSKMRRPWSAWGRSFTGIYIYKVLLNLELY